jgi:ABC-2 type transport system permease protein/lipopolysaccharide transport system permease protein
MPDPDRSHSSTRLRSAIADLAAGLDHYELWGMMGWHDIRQRYSRSVLGPFWLTLNMGLMVLGLGILYAGLFNQSIETYLPYLTLGFIVWALLSGLLTDGTVAFIGSEGIIRQIAVPLSVFVYRALWRNVIILGHNIWIYGVVAVVFGIWPGAVGLLALPALALVCLNGIWVGLLLGAASARFRDIPQVVGNLIPVVFLLTPVMWRADQLPKRAAFVMFNPFYHFVEIVRLPLLGDPAPLLSWLVVLGITIVGWVFTLVFYARYRWRIAYWL